MAYQVLLTGFAIFGAAFAVYFAWRAGISAEKAEHSEHRLAIMRGQVRGLEVTVTALDESLRKLHGKVAADRYWAGKRDEQPELVPTEPDGRARDVCENWSRAQSEGPLSPAARCECAYCQAQRENRAKRRASMRSGVKT